MYETSLRKRLVGIFLPDLGGGGAERVMLHVANFLKREQNFEVHLILTRAQGPYLQEAKGSGLEIIDLSCKRPRRAFIPFLRYVFKQVPDVVISGLETTNVIAAATKLLKPYKLVLTEHNTPSLHYPKQKDPLLRTYPYWAQPFYKLTDRILAISY